MEESLWEERSSRHMCFAHIGLSKVSLTSHTGYSHAPKPQHLVNMQSVPGEQNALNIDSGNRLFI